MRLAAPPGECVAGINQNNKKSLSGVGRALFYGPDLWKLGGGAESPEGNGPYGSPPGRSFYSCASSRALLHVGSLSLWDRQPSNAPPLLLSPAGLASRRGPHTKTHLGLCPRPPNAQAAAGYERCKTSSVRRRRYALKVPAAHFYVEIVDRAPLPRHGGGVGGAEPSAACGGCSEAEHPQRSKKSSKRAAQRFFRAPQGGGGRCARGYLWSASVRSTDLDFSPQKNLNS